MTVNMNFRRVGTPTLPSIRAYDQVPTNTASNHLSSLYSQRSLPREIPLPRHGSPASSRCGSMTGSTTSSGVPPILSLEPPEPIVQPLPLPNAYVYPDSDSPSSAGEDSGAEGVGERRTMLDVRNPGSREGWSIAKPPSIIVPSEEFSLRSEDSFEKSWREGFYKEGFYKRLDEMPPARQLQSEESLRAQIQQSVNAYDSSLVRKLDISASEPSCFPRQRATPPPDFRPFTAGSDTVLPLPAHWQLRDNSRHPSYSAACSPKSIESPIDRRSHASTADPFSRSRSEQLAPLSLPELRSSGSNGSLLSPRLTGISNSDARIRRCASASLLGPRNEGGRGTEDMPPSVCQMKSLTLQESRSPLNRCFAAGSKRRASSPPNEDHLTGNSEPTRKGLLLESVGTDIYGSSRRTPPAQHSLRSSPNSLQKQFIPPLPHAGPGSYSSTLASSPATMWSASLGGYSSVSSLTATDWVPPTISYSQCEELETAKEMSRGTGSDSSTMSGSMQGQQSFNGSGGNMSNTAAPKMTSSYICECCPKKPKKFETQEDLQLHEMEKQYSCQYCNNRFKNKNEAERHQNSLHLRKHSWSCAALAGNFRAAFHESPFRPSLADTCGFCGKEFPVPVQWNARVEHLTTEHKFGECNQAKKFYRADHFRQHLKHSHSGTSGKWTNVLENACMRDETPVNRGRSSAPAVISEEGPE